jgi:hypothetical protein
VKTLFTLRKEAFMLNLDFLQPGSEILSGSPKKAGTAGQ